MRWTWKRRSSTAPHPPPSFPGKARNPVRCGLSIEPRPSRRTGRIQPVVATPQAKEGCDAVMESGVAGELQAVLDRHCIGTLQRRGCNWCRDVAGWRSATVPKGGRYATNASLTVIRSAVWALSFVRRTRGNCDPACTVVWHTSHRSAAEAAAVYDIARTQAQCRQAQWCSGVSSDHGTMARRSVCSTAKAGEVGD
jgi:hypothetical protein